MNITTTYKTNSNGAGKIEARSGDRRKTLPYDHSRSADANHGLAAGALLIEKFADFVSTAVGILDSGRVQHDSLGEGKQKFVL